MFVCKDYYTSLSFIYANSQRSAALHCMYDHPTSKSDINVTLPQIGCEPDILQLPVFLPHVPKEQSNKASSSAKICKAVKY